MAAPLSELDELFASVRRSAFRLETLSVYNAPSSAESLAAFRAGRPLPPRNPDTVPWLRMLADSVARGCTWRRVHVVSRPLSEYLRYEFAGPVLERFIGPVFDHIATTFIDAFVKRADDLYQPRS